MNSSKPHSLLDYSYSERKHLDNLTFYKNISQQLMRKYNYEPIDISKYYSHIISLYLLVEKYIESNIENIEPTIKEIVHASYSVLLHIYDNKGTSDIMDDLFKIYDIKNWDYQNASENQLKWEGAISFKVTLEHKIARIKSFYDGIKFKVEDEKVYDTIGDLINYCMIYLIWSKKDFSKDRKLEFVVKTS